MPITKIDGKRKDGKQAYRVRINYTNALGEYKQAERTAYGYAEAQELEWQLMDKCQESGTLPRHMTVRQLYDEYMTAKEQEVRATTFDKTRRILEYVVLPKLDAVRLDRLNAQTLQKWKNDLGKKNLKIRTKRNYFKEFSTMLNYAVKRQYIPKNPLTLVGNFKSPLFEPSEEKIQYYTADEYLRFASAARESAKSLADWSYYVFFAIAFYTGMRKGEINALKWIDIKDNKIHVRRSVSQKVKGNYIVDLPKTEASYRTLQIPKPLADILAEHRARQQNDARYTNDYFVCGGIKMLADTSIEKRNKKYQTIAELHHIRIHDFRHTHASLLINENVNIQEIARRLGHDDVQVTLRTYAHLYPREEEKAISILDKIKLT